LHAVGFSPSFSWIGVCRDDSSVRNVSWLATSGRILLEHGRNADGSVPPWDRASDRVSGLQSAAVLLLPALFILAVGKIDFIRVCVAGSARRTSRASAICALPASASRVSSWRSASSSAATSRRITTSSSSRAIAARRLSSSASKHAPGERWRYGVGRRLRASVSRLVDEATGVRGEGTISCGPAPGPAGRR
jgi:hypothetical protein